MSLFVTYLIVTAVYSMMLLLTAVINFIYFEKPKAVITTGGDATLPMVSILVPARNEEAAIASCVEYILAVNYPNFELIVLDDNSDDATYPILCRLRDRDHRIRVLTGAQLPADWCGKPYACWQLAHAAKGDYLLFTDADCRLKPDCLLMALGAHQTHKADLVSLIPDLECIGFWERLVVPLLYYTIFAFLPTPLIRGNRHHWFAAANGAFLFLSRKTYFDVGRTPCGPKSNHRGCQICAARQAHWKVSLVW